MPDLLFFLLFGHYVGDFALQTDRVAEAKKNSRRILTLHAFLYTLIIGIFLFLGLYFNHSDKFFSWITAFFLVALFLEHWSQDFFKGLVLNSSRQSFYMDQAIHIMVLFIARMFLYNG